MKNTRKRTWRAWKFGASVAAVLMMMIACSAPSDPGEPDVDPAVTSVTIEGGDESFLMAPGARRAMDFEVEAVGGASEELTWTSDSANASVDVNGIVTAESIGFATITATSVEDPSVSDDITVEISPDAPSVDIEQEQITLELGGSQDLVVDVAVPAGESEDVDFESDSADVVTVDDDGTVTAVSVGSAFVTASLASDASVSDTVEVTVTTDASVSIQQDDAELFVGESLSLAVDVTNVPDGEDEGVTWSSGDDTVVTIADAGTTTPTLSAVGVGTSTIEVVSNFDASLTDTIEVTVQEVGVTISAPATEVVVDETLDLDATVDAPVGEEGVAWTSGDTDTATVDADGVVTGGAPGTVTITATSDFDTDVSDDITLEVVEATSGDGTVTDVTITSTSSLEVEVDGTIDLDATVAADEGVDDSVTWSTSNAGVASVESDGIVSGVTVGTADITATSDFDGSVSDTVTVTVVDGSDEEPVVGSLTTAIVSGEEFEATWDADATSTYDVYAVASTDAETLEGTGLASSVGSGDAVPLPPMGLPVIRVVDAGTEATVAEGSLGDFVYSDEDYDVYVSSDVDDAEPPIDGSLRQVLASADPGSVIAFASDIATIELYGVELSADGDNDAHLMIYDGVTILGPPGGLTLQGVSAGSTGDAAVDFSYNSRMMYIAPGADVTLENLTITGGTFIYNGGGIMNQGTLTIRNSEVSDNRAWSTGGGIVTAAGSTLVVEDSMVSENRAYVLEDEVDVDFPIRGGAGSSGEIDDGGWGGGLWIGDGADVTITNTTFSNNDAKVSGAGVYADANAAVSMSGSDVLANTAEHADFTNWGGGIYALGILSYSGGSISNNVGGAGGGLYVDQPSEVTLGDVLFSQNVAEYGGGIYHIENEAGDNLDPDDPVAATDITFDDNVATVNASSADYGLVEFTNLESLRSVESDESSGRYVEPTGGQKRH